MNTLFEQSMPSDAILDELDRAFRDHEAAKSTHETAMEEAEEKYNITVIKYPEYARSTYPAIYTKKGYTFPSISDDDGRYLSLSVDKLGVTQYSKFRIEEFNSDGSTIRTVKLELRPRDGQSQYAYESSVLPNITYRDNTIAPAPVSTVGRANPSTIDHVETHIKLVEYFQKVIHRSFDAARDPENRRNVRIFDRHRHVEPPQLAPGDDRFKVHATDAVLTMQADATFDALFSATQILGPEAYYRIPVPHSIPTMVIRGIVRAINEAEVMPNGESPIKQALKEGKFARKTTILAPTKTSVTPTLHFEASVEYASATPDDPKPHAEFIKSISPIYAQLFSPVDKDTFIRESGARGATKARTLKDTLRLIADHHAGNKVASS